MDYKQIYKISKIYDVIEKDKTNNMLSHAYLVSYKESYLLSRISDFIACHILGDLDDARLVTKVVNGNHADIKVYPTDKTIKVKDVEEICDLSLILPLEADRKIFILKDFDKATLAAQNKLLKTLEEPPQSVVFVILTTSLYNILPTIKSRCKIVNLNEFDSDKLSSTLMSLYDMPDLNDKIAKSFGNFAELEKLLSKDTNKVHELCLDTLLNMQGSQSVLSYSVKYNMTSAKGDVFDEFLYIFRDLMMIKSGKEPMFMDDAVVLQNISQRYTPNAIATLAHESIKAKQKLKSNCNPQACIEDLLMKILEVKVR